MTDLPYPAQLLAQSVSVTEINAHIKHVLDSHDEIQGLWVRGEIADLHYHTQSGHIYFCLKDLQSRIRCVMFRGDAASVSFRLQDGLSVVVYGDISAYTRGGTYQLYARRILGLGDGSLARNFELVRQRLAEDGLLDVDRKRKLPRFPARIAMITSPEGAALRDVIAVLQRRNPIVELVVVPCAVQGDSAVSSIVNAFDIAAEDGRFDLGILTRGGGAADDLWVFNDETIARRLADMPFPMVCAVGHERDFTICDLVADLRAPTPSAAAEMAVPDMNVVLDDVSHLESRVRRALTGLADMHRSRVTALESSWVFRKPEMIVASHRQALEELAYQLDRAITNVIEPRMTKLELTAGRLDACSPLKTLSRGYSLVTNKRSDQIVVSVSQVAAGDDIEVRVSDGVFSAHVEGSGGDSEVDN